VILRHDDLQHWYQRDVFVVNSVVQVKDLATGVGRPVETALLAVRARRVLQLAGVGGSQLEIDERRPIVDGVEAFDRQMQRCFFVERDALAEHR